MIVVAILGLIVNLIGMALLRTGAEESLNVQGAFLEVVSDLLGSVGVVIAGILIWVGDWDKVDPDCFDRDRTLHYPSHRPPDDKIGQRIDGGHARWNRSSGCRAGYRIASGRLVNPRSTCLEYYPRG